MSELFPPMQQFPGGSGQLVLNLRKPSGWGAGSVISPSVRIDGYPAPARWEQNVYTVPAGQRNVAVESRYMWTFGQQQLNVNVAPGQTLEVHYTGPALTFMAGAMGYEPQQRPGRIGVWLILGIPIGLLLLALLIALVT
ncbi:MAG: hypothetical protein H0T91_11355 [Propionibacteriaceae bacterium]|nr:hypothetical protein [Propionibacteriaceae bacterium]